jgi:hypothetical protein
MRKVIKMMERPIGYWLKHLDRLIEAAAERTFAEQKLTRRHWQVMNVLRESPQQETGLTEAIRPFWGVGAITPDEVTGELTRRGWLPPRTQAEEVPHERGKAWWAGAGLFAVRGASFGVCRRCGLVGWFGHACCSASWRAHQAYRAS